MEVRNTNHILDTILKNEQNSPDIGAQVARRHGNVKSTSALVEISD